MRIYLAGPMRGIYRINFPAFAKAAAKLRAEGHVVISPAERDNIKYSADISKGNTFGDEQQAVHEHGFSLREALGADLAWICAEADGIAMLPNWEDSKGAAAERSVAVALGLVVLYL